jgi:hypothetical protein
MLTIKKAIEVIKKYLKYDDLKEQQKEGAETNISREGKKVFIEHTYLEFCKDIEKIDNLFSFLSKIQDTEMPDVEKEFTNRFGNCSDDIEVGSNSNYTYGTFRKFCRKLHDDFLAYHLRTIKELEEKLTEERNEFDGLRKNSNSYLRRIEDLENKLKKMREKVDVECIHDWKLEQISDGTTSMLLRKKWRCNKCLLTQYTYD